jgi:hypothetical protein
LVRDPDYNSNERCPDTGDNQEFLAAQAGPSEDGIRRAVLLEHVAMIHKLAAPLAGKGKLVVASYGQDPATGEELDAKIEHVRIGDVEGTVLIIQRLARERHRNVYMPLAVMRLDLPPRKKGKEEDVVGVLAIITDFDDADAPNYARRLPVEAPYAVESSADRFQTFLPLDRPAAMAEAKAVAIALKQAIGGDHCSVDMSHVWRVPGLLNWPNRKKVVEHGRSPEPQIVRVAVPWDGEVISLEDLRKAIPVQPAATNGAAFDFSAPADEEVTDQSVTAADLPAKLIERMKYAPLEGQRSEHAHGIFCTLVELGWTDDDIFAEAKKHTDGGFAERYVGDDKLLQGEITRARAKAKGDRREWSGGQRSSSNTAGTKETEIKWSDPLPLTAPDEEPRPYPIHALPPVLRGACEAYQAFGQQPTALVACSALAAASLATQGLANVERAPGLSGPISLNLIVVAQSGERKTSADKRMSKAVRLWELDKKAAMKPEVDAARGKIAAFEAERDGLIAKIKGQAGKHAKAEVGDADQMKHDLEELEKRAPATPILPELFYEDVTPEALAEYMAAGWPSASLWSDEAGLVVGGHGMGDKSLLRYLTLFNRFWDGQPFSRKRSTTKSFTLNGRRLTACLMMQETVLAELLAAGNGASRGSGFMARFLMAWPVSTMGTRLYRPGDPDHPALVAYDAKLRELLDKPLPIKDEGMVLDPPVLPLSAEARETWIELHDEVERALDRYGEFEGVKDFAAKTADNAARIAGVFHVLEHDPVGEIAAETMEDAAELALWHLHEAKRIMGAIEIPQALADARALFDWLLTQDGDIGPRTISQFGPSRLRDRARRDEAIETLIERRHIARVKVDGATVLRINPKLRGAQ